ncbi:hypothetical protein GGS23DRAFT_611342 [Durotheca rogersii]|uniref:uncharacterized protein n=1 Tax=Durotheca rogersii TaxID=419775 RepID=UPI002220B36F|nr:uncharacterized protein GGS23DRAFT_611342 [Durotheca rogersii]KAI5861755.1 hypothetical protein GGS23DRAFT_611342 [Durotheca rogersii]
MSAPGFPVALPAGLALRGDPLSPSSSGAASRGRCVVAARAFPAGRTVARFDDSPAVVATPDTPRLAQTCSYCLAVGGDAAGAAAGPRLRACTACRAARYCSVACQRADWRGAHGRGECSALRRAAGSGAAEGPPRVLPTPVRALVQVLVRPAALAAVAGAMEGHAARVRAAAPDRWAAMELQARAALHYLGREAGPREVAEAVDVLCKLEVNSFNRFDADFGQSGIYVNPALAMVNHSCVPNAFVQFTGRAALLRAYRDIAEGEEIEISYIECAWPRPQRQQALRSRYFFDCACRRCADDLDVYQVCRAHPGLELNAFSLVPDPDALRHPPIQPPSDLLRRTIDDIYPACSAPLQERDPAERPGQLRRRWKMCAPLREAGLFAVEPLTQVLVDAGAYFAEQSNYAYSLAIACFLALRSDPYREPMPFSGPRAKGMLMIAKLLALTASETSPASGGAGAASLPARISQALSKMDQATMCQTVLAMVVHYFPDTYSKEWLVYRQARDLLDDLESLPGRETENALVRAFAAKPSGPEEARFFETAVLRPIQVLAQFALEGMDVDFDS